MSERSDGFRVNDRRWWAQADQRPGDAPAAGAREDAPRYVQALEAEVARVTALADDKDRLAREAAARARSAVDEVERAKQRIRRESDKELEQRRRDIMLGFLCVLDDLDRALAAAREAGDSAVSEGVELVRRRFVAELGKHGVTHEPAMGQRFDPERHDAVSRVPVADPALAGVVVGVAREGYRIGEVVLRPAAVAVGKVS